MVNQYRLWNAFNRKLRYCVVPVLLIIVITVSLTHGAVFKYHWMDAYISVRPPVVWLEDPLYPGVYVELFDHKTRADVVVHANNIGTRLINRTGHWFDMRREDVVWKYFEQYGANCDYYITDEGAREYWLLETHPVVYMEGAFSGTSIP